MPYLGEIVLDDYTFYILNFILVDFDIDSRLLLDKYELSQAVIWYIIIL